MNSLTNLNAQLQKEAGPTPELDREQLIAEHLPQVKLIARRIHDRLPSNVNLEDLISTGIVGLISAIDRYQPSQGVKLRTYAEYKIRGAILDSLRDLDWAPRKQRRRAKDIERAVAAAEQRVQHAPTEKEIAAELGVSVEEYREWAAESRSLRIGSLENRFPNSDEGRDPLQQLPEREDLLPSQLLERSELERLLNVILERMPQQERTVVTLYYREEMSLREIAKTMELHESRISQLKTQALGRLKMLLETRWPQRGAHIQKLHMSGRRA